MTRSALLLALAVISTGCATTSTTGFASEPVPFPPTMVELSATPSEAYDRVVAAMIGAGYIVNSGDRQGGLIKTAVIPGEVGMLSVMGGMYNEVSRTDYFIIATILSATTGSGVALNATALRTHQSGDKLGDDVGETPVYGCPAEGSSDIVKQCRAARTRLRARLDALASILTR